MIPLRLAYLENALAGNYLAGDAFSIADITVASMLINYHYAGESIAASYPKLHRYLRRLLLRECFRTALERERPAAESVGGLDMSLLRNLQY